MNQPLLPEGKYVESLKLNDVKKLLIKHYGQAWQKLEELSYYKNVLENNTCRETTTADEANSQCQNMEESCFQSI